MSAPPLVHSLPKRSSAPAVAAKSSGDVRPAPQPDSQPGLKTKAASSSGTPDASVTRAITAVTEAADVAAQARGANARTIVMAAAHALGIRPQNEHAAILALSGLVSTLPPRPAPAAASRASDRREPPRLSAAAGAAGAAGATAAGATTGASNALVVVLTLVPISSMLLSLQLRVQVATGLGGRQEPLASGKSRSRPGRTRGGHGSRDSNGLVGAATKADEGVRSQPEVRGGSHGNGSGSARASAHGQGSHGGSNGGDGGGGGGGVGRRRRGPKP